MKDPRNIRDYENLREILGKELGDALYSCVNYIFDFEENTQVEFAIQQFIGFVQCANNRNVISLAESMGLTKEEWIIIRKDHIVNNFDIKEDLDEYFDIN